MTRNPRQDPRPGDVLRGLTPDDPPVMVICLVTAVDEGDVCWTQVEPDGDSYSGVSPIEEWRRDSADDTVLYVAEEA